MIRSRMITAVGAGLVAVLLACSKDEGPQSEVFTATLSGANEVPAKTTNATGTAKVTVNSDRTLTVDLAVTGLTASAHHIHGPAAAGANAGVVVAIPAIAAGQIIATTAFTGAVKYDSLLVLLRNGQAYVNVHTTANPGGEIRGQLVRQ